MQRDFGWMQEYKPPVNLSDEVVRSCKDTLEALQKSWERRRVKCSITYAAALLGMPKSHLSNALNGKKYLPNECRVAFMWFVGNLLIRQYEDFQLEQAGMDRELVEAEMRLNELRARKAA